MNRGIGCAKATVKTMSGSRPRTFRSLFISDVHLGSKAAKAEFLIDFLRHHDADIIYLVGLIVVVLAILSFLGLR